MIRGDMDDFPLRHAHMDRERWLSTWDTAYEAFCAEVDLGMDTVIDPYASEQPAEFFASSPSFFHPAAVVHSSYPELYRPTIALLPAGSGRRLPR